jgi:transposase-like protein
LARRHQSTLPGRLKGGERGHGHRHGSYRLGQAGGTWSGCGPNEDGAGGKVFLRSLGARSLAGVKIIISDAHRGLKSALASELPGAAWQRWRTYFMRNLLTKVAKSAQNLGLPWCARFSTNTMSRRAGLSMARSCSSWRSGSMRRSAGLPRFPQVHMAAVPVWSNNFQERLNREIRRRTDGSTVSPFSG